MLQKIFPHAAKAAGFLCAAFLSAAVPANAQGISREDALDQEICAVQDFVLDARGMGIRETSVLALTRGKTGELPQENWPRAELEELKSVIIEGNAHCLATFVARYLRDTIASQEYARIYELDMDGNAIEFPNITGLDYTDPNDAALMDQIIMSIPNPHIIRMEYASTHGDMHLTTTINFIPSQGVIDIHAHAYKPDGSGDAAHTVASVLTSSWEAQIDHETYKTRGTPDEVAQELTAKAREAVAAADQGIKRSVLEIGLAF